MVNDHVRSLIESALAGDEAPQAERAFEALTVRGGSLVIAATFALAVMKRFPEGAPLERVRDFVSASREHLAEPEKAPQLYVEALVRSILGEQHLVKEVPGDRILPIEAWLISVLVEDMYPSAEGKSLFVEEATDLACEWLEEAKLG